MMVATKSAMAIPTTSATTLAGNHPAANESNPKAMSQTPQAAIARLRSGAGASCSERDLLRL